MLCVGKKTNPEWAVIAPGGAFLFYRVLGFLKTLPQTATILMSVFASCIALKHNSR